MFCIQYHISVCCQNQNVPEGSAEILPPAQLSPLPSSCGHPPLLDAFEIQIQREIQALSFV